MLARVLEPEVMDSAEEAHDYDAMDHSEVNCRFVADFLIHWKNNGAILDVGTGTAQIPIEFCGQSQVGEMIAIDMANHMLQVARRNVEKAGLSHRIVLRYCDAKQMPFADGLFSAVISNSIVHHIPEPERVFSEMIRVTQPGGVLFVRDLLRPESDEQVRHLVQTYAGDENDHQRQMFEDSLRAALTVDEVRRIVTGFGFDSSTVQQNSDRHWTWIASAQ